MLATAAAVLLAATVAVSPPSASRLAAQAPGLSPHVLELALRAYGHAREMGQVEREVLAVIDYSLPSTQRRLWIFDLAREALLFHELVAHGRGSGDDLASHFSNQPNSLASSLGVFATGGTYQGKHGRSLKLLGLEPGVNDHAEPRAVVIHGADYVSDAYAHAHQRLGRSWGCPAVQAALAPQIIDSLRGGAVLFAYYPDAAWLGSSPYLR